MAETIYHGATSDDAEVLCVVVHGRNQTQQDMLDSIVTRLDVTGVRFALPKSDEDGWYAARAIDPLTEETNAELSHAVGQVAALIDAERSKAPGRPVLLCGFSQGACLSAELLMRHPTLVDGACILTACRVGAETDELPQAPLDELPIYASCGDEDPWIPQVAYHRMLVDLTRAGARIRTDMFPGRPHAVTDTEVANVAEMLHALAAGRPVFDGAQA